MVNHPCPVALHDAAHTRDRGNLAGPTPAGVRMANASRDGHTTA
jgi:hypothetical protein